MADCSQSAMYVYFYASFPQDHPEKMGDRIGFGLTHSFQSTFVPTVVQRLYTWGSLRGHDLPLFCAITTTHEPLRIRGPQGAPPAPYGVVTSHHFPQLEGVNPLP